MIRSNLPDLFQVFTMYLILLGSLLSVFVAQFLNTMILNGVAISFIPAAICVMNIQVSHPSQ